jgi:hypothetical protein
MNNDEYLTKDLGEAAALITTGAPLREIQPTPTHSVFIFDDAKKSKELSDKYWNGTLAAPLLSAFSNQKILKNRVFRGTRR